MNLHRKRGRPRYIPSPKQRCQAFLMASLGVRQSRIAQTLGIDPKTLRKYFREDLDRPSGEAPRA